MPNSIREQEIISIKMPSTYELIAVLNHLPSDPLILLYNTKSENFFDPKSVHYKISMIWYNKFFIHDRNKPSSTNVLDKSFGHRDVLFIEGLMRFWRDIVSSLF